MEWTNKKIAELLRNASAAYQIKGGNLFQIRAYDTASDSIENATEEVKDLWEAGRLDEIPGIGERMREYLDELFKTGKVAHFEKIFEGIPEDMFEFLKVSGIGPKTAYKLAEAGAVSIDDLEERIKSGYLLKKGFGGKTLDKILLGIEEYRRKSNRILLPVAGEIAKSVLNHLRSNPKVLRTESLGSLRRRVSTVGDIDISVASDDPESVIEHFKKTPGIERVLEAGDRTATILLKNGVQIDLMVQPPDHYGSLLQHFTGSKSHNVHIRKIAKEKGLSLSEYGIREIHEEGKQFSQDLLLKCDTEEEFYKKLGMQYIPPELRENTGEIEAALAGKLPRLIELADIKGDLQSHSLYSDGHNSIKEMAIEAKELSREYLALTEHSYPSLDFKNRKIEIEEYNYSGDGIRVINGLEVNINADATMQVPDEILADHELVLGSIHTAFRQSREEMTQRLIKAIENPHVDIIAHPTGCLLLEREGIDADWEKVFLAAKKYNKILEINAYPNRLDLPDTLVREAKRFGIKFSISTDSHQLEHLKLIEYGVSVARRGWVTKEEVVNTLPWDEFKKVFNLKD